MCSALVGAHTAPAATVAPPCSPQNKAAASGAFDEHRRGTFLEFLASCRLPPFLREVVFYAIMNASRPVEEYHALSAEAGMTAVLRYLNALGRHGNTAFLVRVREGELGRPRRRRCDIVSD